MSPVQFEGLVRCPGTTRKGHRCDSLIERKRALCEGCLVRNRIAAKKKRARHES